MLRPLTRLGPVLLLLLTFCFTSLHAQTTEADSCDVMGGTIALVDGGGDSTSICLGQTPPDSISVTLTGAEGDSSLYVVTDTATIILAITTDSSFTFETAGAGTCLVWHLAYDTLPAGAAAGVRADTLSTGCFSLSNPITVVRDTGTVGACATSSVAPPLQENQVTIFPNPAEQTLFVDLADLTSGPTILEVFDLNGRQLTRQTLRAANGRRQIDLSELAAGTYLLRVTNDGKSLTQRFVH